MRGITTLGFAVTLGLAFYAGGQRVRPATLLAESVSNVAEEAPSKSDEGRSPRSAPAWWHMTIEELQRYKAWRSRVMANAAAPNHTPEQMNALLGWTPRKWGAKVLAPSRTVALGQPIEFSLMLTNVAKKAQVLLPMAFNPMKGHDPARGHLAYSVQENPVVAKRLYLVKPKETVVLSFELPAQPPGDYSLRLGVGMINYNEDPVEPGIKSTPWGWNFGETGPFRLKVEDAPRGRVHDMGVHSTPE